MEMVKVDLKLHRNQNTKRALCNGYGLVSLFNGITIFVGYLMQKPFLWKNSRGTI